MAEAITITIDGVEIKTQPGRMVLEAAIEAGVYIPYLCYHTGMKPFAACRMCVVSVEGGRGFPAACTLPVQEGMKIRSESHEVNELRRSVMQMLIAGHPDGCLTCHRVDICGPGDVCLRHVSVNDRCVTCPKNERCEFKDTVRYLGMELESPLEYKYKQLPLEVSDPFYDRDYNLCITCGRCVRVCEEVRGDNAICFVERSGRALVGTSLGSSLLESGCEFCGACIDVCPVGALVERDHKWEKARRVERATCPHCPVGCQLNLEINDRNQVIRAVPELNSPANRGQACFKGKFGLEFLNQRGRVRQPLIRRNGTLEETTWDEALDHIAQRLGEYKGDSFALLSSPDSTNEEHYLAQKFARVVMHTNNVDVSSNLHPELTLGLERGLGYAAGTNPIWELEQSDCIVVFNSNVTEAHNVVGVPIKRAVQRGTRLIVIDPREVELTRYAHSWLRPRPGTELLLLGGILKSLLDQGLERQEWIQTHCEDPATLRYALHSLDLAEVVRETGVPVEAISGAATWFGQAQRGSVVYGLDNVPEDLQRDCVHALVDLALLTGNVGQPNSGLYPLLPGANEQGAWDMGCVPNRLPGGRGWPGETAQQEMEQFWHCNLPTTRGLGLAAAVAAAGTGQVRAMLVVGDSPNFYNGKLGGQLGDGLAALGNLDFLVVQHAFLTPLAQRAEVVLPRTHFAEKDGTYTNLARRVQRIRPALPLAADNHSRPEGWVIAELSRRLQSQGFEHDSPGQVLEEIARICPLYGGISHRRLEAGGRLVFRTGLESPKPTQLLYSGKEYPGLQWPCPSADSPGTATLYLEGFPRGNANPITPEFRLAVASADPDYPVQYVPGRVLLQRDRPLQIVPGKLNRIARDELVQLHPADAAAWSIDAGDSLEVQTPRGRLVGLAALDPSVPRGAVAVTTLFGQLAVDLQASEDIDPMSRVPGLDILPARVVKLAPVPAPAA